MFWDPVSNGHVYNGDGWDSTYTSKQYSGHQPGVLQFNFFLTLCTQRQHQTRQVEGLVLQDRLPPPTSVTNRKSRLSPELLNNGYRLQVPEALPRGQKPGFYPYFWPTDSKLEVHTTASWLWLTCYGSS